MNKDDYFKLKNNYEVKKIKKCYKSKGQYLGLCGLLNETKKVKTFIAIIDKIEYHYHLYSVEKITILEGQLDLFAGDDHMVLKEGDTYIIGRMTLHWAMGNKTVIKIEKGCYKNNDFTKAGRLISCGGIVRNNKNEILLVEQETNKYCFPKGRKQNGETIKDCAIREFKEETNILKFDILKKLGKYERVDFKLRDTVKEIHLFQFSLNGLTEKDIKNIHTDKENISVRWVPVSKVEKFLYNKRDKEFWQSVKHKIV